MKFIKALFDAAVIIPIAIVFNVIFQPDGPYIWEEKLLMIIAFYSIHWSMWRVILGGCGRYSVAEILQPIVLFVSVFILAVTLGMLFPNHEFLQKRKDVANEMTTYEIAMNCPKARWCGTVHWRENWEMHSKKFLIEGDSKTAWEKIQKYADALLEEHPLAEDSWTWWEIDLYWMPRQFCRDNEYSLDWSDPERLRWHGQYK